MAKRKRRAKSAEGITGLLVPVLIVGVLAVAVLNNVDTDQEPKVRIITPVNSPTPRTPPTLSPTMEPVSEQADVMAIEPVAYVTTGGLNVRSCASRECEALGQVAAGTEMMATGLVSGERVAAGNEVWLRVQYGGVDAYVYSGLMTLKAPSQEQSIQAVQPTTVPIAPQAVQRPRNCAEAVEMGLTAEEAAQWSHLDRDKDGVACYGD